MAKKFDITVIGSGPGGYRAATGCARRGACVALVEQGFIGGTCLNHGCIPSKILLASARTLLSAKTAGQMGIEIPSATPNWPKIQQRKDTIIENFRRGMESGLKPVSVELIRGRAVAVRPDRIKVNTEKDAVDIETGKIILATGSTPIQLDYIPFDGKTVISSKEALCLTEIPESMLIIGGGVIGCEMACVYTSMGCKVTIIEALSRLLPMEDKWVGRILEKEFKKLDIEVITSQKVTGVDKTAGTIRAEFDNNQTLTAEKILICVGRRATCDKETLESLRLKTSGSTINVNEKLETTAENVYAIGDVVGTTYLAHGATTEAEVAAANATGANRTMPDYSSIPRVVYTFPEAASVGKSEQTCKIEGIEYSCGRAFFKANGRSVAHNEPAGEVRLLREKKTNSIIGVTIVGSMATELIMLSAALLGRNARDIKLTFAHPGFSETIEEAIRSSTA